MALIPRGHARFSVAFSMRQSRPSPKILRWLLSFDWLDPGQDCRSHDHPGNPGKVPL
jgi:hypothetical protein